jgi:hypothetical protein
MTTNDGSLGRRSFVSGAIGAVASGCLVGTVGSAAAAPSGRGRRRVAPAPAPIPGGLEVAPGVVIHTFAPGDPAITLPFTGFTLGGFDVEPGTITDFNGSSAVAFHVGSAVGSDGRTYNLETDLRVFEGDYVVGGETHRGAFAFV